MNIDIKDIITLSDNNRYLVVSKTKRNNEIYYLLANTENIQEIKIVFEYKEEQTVVEIDDEKLIKELQLYFTKSTLEDIKNII